MATRSRSDPNARYPGGALVGGACLTVTFTLFGPANPTCTGAPIFTSGAKALAEEPPLTANSGSFTPSAPGSYSWVAVYSGDANYTSVISPCGAPNATSVVTKASPTIATDASGGGTIGTSVNGVATLGGGASPTGTVTFGLFSDNTCATQVFTSTNSLAGGTATSGSFTPRRPRDLLLDRGLQRRRPQRDGHIAVRRPQRVGRHHPVPVSAPDPDEQR